MKNILFVSERHCGMDGHSQSNLFHNIFETCENSRLFNIRHCFFEDVADINKDIFLYTSGIDLIVFSYYHCDTRVNPSLETIKLIKELYPDTKLVFLWWDAAHPCIQSQIKELDAWTSLHINFDATDLSNITAKSWFGGVPQCKRMFHYEEEKEFDISFVGQTDHYPDRIQYLNHLLSNEIKVNIRGGRVKENLTPEEYANIICRSKINLNFCYTPQGFPQCKGRVWEILASQTLLMEEANTITSQYLEPYIEYIPFYNLTDLENKIKYYLNHEVARFKIIQAATKKYYMKYDYPVFWNKIYNL